MPATLPMSSSTSCWCAFWTHLQDKPAPFRVIDTHAGAGVYDLAGEEAQRSGEWLTGIARVMQARFSEAALPLLAPYLDIVRVFNRQSRAQGLSGIAADRARAAAAAGPPHRLRGRTESPQTPDRGAAPRYAGQGSRPRWLGSVAGLRAAERAAWSGADRPDLTRRGTSSHGWPTALPKAFAKWPTGSYLLWYPAKSRRATDGPRPACRRGSLAPAPPRANACAWNSAPRRRPRTEPWSRPVCC